MGLATDLSLDSASRLGLVGAGLHVGIQRAMGDIRREQRRELGAVEEVVAHLQEARRGQVAALRRATAAEDRADRAEREAAGAQAEIRMLREALLAERRLTDALRDVCGVA